MDRISGLSDELLVKILSFVPTKVAVSTSVLSKRWESVWIWVPRLEFKTKCYGEEPELRDFINKSLPLLRAPVIEGFRLNCCYTSFQHEDINQWLGIAVSRCLRELHIDYFCCSYTAKPAVLLPSSLYTCESLVTLKLEGNKILVDVPRTVSLPSLKTLLLGEVTYANKGCLRLLLSYCPVLEDLTIHRDGYDNADPIVVISPSLQRLTLPIVDGGHNIYGEYVIVTSSLKYYKVEEHNGRPSYLVVHMPEVEEADITVDEYLERIFESITSVKRLSLCVSYMIKYDWGEGYLYHDGIFFNNLEHLKLCIRFDYWSKLLFRLLQDSPNLRVLSLNVDVDGRFKKYEPISWDSVPSCLLESLETFEFDGYRGMQEERDFVSFIFKNACHLKSSSITPCTRVGESWSSSESSDD